MFKFNSFCKECFDPYKIVWNCKKNIFEKDWLYLCYNCIRLNKYLYGKYFKLQFQNIKSFHVQLFFDLAEISSFLNTRPGEIILIGGLLDSM